MASGALSVADDSFPERIGWHDVVLAGSAEPTHALTAYPPAEEGSPRNVRAIRIDEAWSPHAHAVVDAGASEPATSAGLERSLESARRFARARHERSGPRRVRAARRARPWNVACAGAGARQGAHGRVARRRARHRPTGGDPRARADRRAHGWRPAARAAAAGLQRLVRAGADLSVDRARFGARRRLRRSACARAQPPARHGPDDARRPHAFA